MLECLLACVRLWIQSPAQEKKKAGVFRAQKSLADAWSKRVFVKRKGEANEVAPTEIVRGSKMSNMFVSMFCPRPKKNQGISDPAGTNRLFYMVA